jgi:tryptophan halogenase
MSALQKKLKVAVIGGGTAGYMAAAHITKHFPCFELYHIYNSRIPTIGVGEGTQANFPEWLEHITGLSFYELQERCSVTRKYAIQFENWGTKHKRFLHNFYPIKVAHGYHISADKLTGLLEEYVSSTRVDKKIINIKSNGVAVNITFEDQTQLEVDFAFDASGFPKLFDNSEYTKISLIPTNAAFIRRGSVVEFNSATRSVARPYGWIFIIPLTTHTSYGYVYNSLINSRSEIEGDFNDFFREENVATFSEAKYLTFPNFTSRSFFDGSLFKIGNAASFLEPLEATAIGIAHAQISYASQYLNFLSKSSKRREKLAEEKLKVFNDFWLNLVLKAALFVSWHYVSGSCFNTDFWQFAKANFEQEIKKLENPNLLHEFENYLQSGSELNYSLLFSKLNSFIKSFGGFRPASFYEVGYGIGYYPCKVGTPNNRNSNLRLKGIKV